MAKQRQVANTEEVLAALIEEQKKITNIREWRQVEAVWLREKLHMSGSQVAEALNYRLQTVHLLWHKWIKEGLNVFANKKPPGGRNNAYLTAKEEGEFLRTFTEKVPQGGIVEIQEIKEAFEARIRATVPKSTIYRLLNRHGWRKIAPGKKHPKSDPILQEELKKLISEAFDAGKDHPRIKIMFMDEARFGRTNDVRRCWAPQGIRPVVPFQIVREYTYAYAAVCPFDGDLDALILPDVNAQSMSLFLQELSRNHICDHIVLILDRAGWHTAKDLTVPQNITLHWLPPYSPELNPVEHLWDEMREKWFLNRYFASLDAVENQLVKALKTLMETPKQVTSIYLFSWMIN